MAEVKLYRVEFIQNNLFGQFVAGDVLEIYADEDNLTDTGNRPYTMAFEGIKAYLNGSQIFGGLAIVVGKGYSILTKYDANLLYRGEYTVVHSLRTFFPYASYYTVLPPTGTCDLIMVGTPEIVKASSATTADGEIQINATSSYSIKYKLGHDFYYQDSGLNSTGNFTGLLPGSYRVFMRDENNCGLNVLVDVGYEETYGVKYRLEYTDHVAGFSTKVDILEKDYASSVTEITAGGDPVTLSVRAEGSTNKFRQLLTTNMDVTLMSLTESQYIELYTNNPNRYRVKYYKDTGSGYNLKWTGKLLPFIYSEAYKSPPYDVTVTATDGLPELKDQFFFKDDGSKFYGTQSLIKLIAYCLRKTGLGLPIRCGINMYSTGMNSTAADDPLDQAYVDVDCFYIGEDNPSLEYVLTEILKPFGANIIQWDDYWHIRRVEELGADYDYREFDKYGDYSTNGTASHVKDIDYPTADGIMFTAFPQRELQNGYGKVRINYLLGLKDNFLTNGDFRLVMRYSAEKEGYETAVDRYGWDLYNPGYTLNERVGVIDNDNISLDLEHDDTAFTAATIGTAYIESLPYTLKMGVANTVKISLKYNIKRTTDISVMPYGITFPFVRVRIRVKYGTLYLTSNGSWTSTETTIDFFEDKLNEWIERTVTAQQPTTGTPVDGMAFTVRLYVAHPLYAQYYTTLSAIAAITTYTGGQQVLPNGYRVEYRDTTYMYYYELEDTSSVVGVISQSLENGIPPGDFHLTNNKRRWVLKHKRKIDDTAKLEQITFAVDYIRAEFLVDSKSPIDSIVRTQNAEPENLMMLEETVILGSSGDLIVTDYVTKVIPVKSIEYDGFIKRVLQAIGKLPTQTTGSATITLQEVSILSSNIIYTGWLRNSTGATRWDEWTRDGISEAEKLHGIHLKMLALQYGSSWSLLRSTLTSKTQYIEPIHVFREVNDGNKIYYPMAITYNDKQNSFSADLFELSDVDETENAAEAAFTTGFSIGYKS